MKRSALPVLAAAAVAAASLLAATPGFGQALPAAPPAEPPPDLSVTYTPLKERPTGAKIAWDPRWPKFRPAEYVATGLLAAAAFASLAIPPSEGRWTAINGFDAEVRSALRIEGDRYRDVARDASDLVLGLMINELTIDALIVTWWGYGRGSVAWQLTMIDIEALALNAAVNGLVSGFSSRERPYGGECQGPEERQNRDCRDSKRYRSYFSGHTSTAFTTAGLVCSHHAHLPLYGGGAPDTLACAASFLAAASVGALRVVSDQHFATDVLTGAAFGTLTGLGLPWLLHYRGGAPAGGDARRPGGVSIGFAPAPFGGVMTGTF